MSTVISRKNLPTRFPVLFTLVAWLLLDRIQPAGWVLGVVWTLVGLLWIGSAISIIRDSEVDLFQLVQKK